MKRYKVTHIMNKKQLILILVAGLLSSTASALNLNPKAAVPAVEDADGNVTTAAVPAVPRGTVVIAIEIKASELDTVTGEAYNVTGESGFIIPTGAGYFARFQLGGGATFATALTDDSVDDVVDDRDPKGLGDQFQIAAGGGAGDDYAVVSVGNADIDQGAGLIRLGQEWTLSGVTYNIEDRVDVSFTYTLHQDAGDAVNEESPLDTQSGMLIQFKAATSMAGKAAGNTKQIEVSTSGTLFVGSSKVSTIMEISLTTTDADAGYPDTTEPNPELNDIAENVNLTVTGNFASINLGDADADPVVAPVGKVWLDKSADCRINTPGIPATTDPVADAVPAVPGGDNLGVLTVNRVSNAQITAEVELPQAGRKLSEYAKAYLCLETDGKTEIPEGRYSGKLEMSSNTGFDPHPDVEFGGSSLEKNADSAEVHLLLTPNGTYMNFVRLSNTSGVPVDNLRVTLYNDAGDSQSFDLSDVDGVSSNELDPYASTHLININVLYAAAQAVELEDDEEMFTVTGGQFGNKLRARVDGSFQEGAIDIQALSLSSDLTTFFSF